MMEANKGPATAIDNGVYITTEEEKPTRVSSGNVSPKPDCTKHMQGDAFNMSKPDTWFTKATPSIIHYALLAILGLLIWGILWSVWSDGWGWNGPWFRLAVVAGAAWASGVAVQGVTDFPPMLAATLVGILARNVGYLDMRDFISIDMFLRKIYPVIVLGKGSLAWDANFMTANWKSIVTLGAVPWALEVATLATCMHLIFNHPWIWGFMFGSFFASVSCPIVMPAVMKNGNSPGRTRVWPQFVCCSSAIDMILSVGMFGIFYSFIFVDVSVTYRYIKAVLTMFVAVGGGLVWGNLAGWLPHKKDMYATELRILFILFGGLFANFISMYLGWGGVGAVLVTVCNPVAVRHWVRDGWKLMNNPATTAYRVMWSVFEPMLFAYTGAFFEVKGLMSDTFLLGLAILAICLLVRLTATALVCTGMTLKERIFMCICWSPKSIVEAVLCPMPLNTLIMQGGTDLEKKYAEDILKITVQTILITTVIVFLLAKYLGPTLLRDKKKDNENGPGS